MDGGSILLNSGAPPLLVFDERVISVHCEILRSASLLNDKFDFWMCFTAGHCGQRFPKFSGRRVSQRCRNPDGTFPTPWFAWVQSAGIPAYWLLCLTHSRLCLFTRCWALWTQKLGPLCWKPRAGKGSPFKGLEQVRKWPCMLQHCQEFHPFLVSTFLVHSPSFFSRSSPYLFF